MTLKNNRAHQCYFKLCASFRSHWWIQTVELQSGNAYCDLKPCDLEIWQMTLKNNRAPLLSIIKLCAKFHCHMWIQTGDTVRKRISGVMTSVTLTFNLWPFAWTSHMSMVITPENFRMIRWQEHWIWLHLFNDDTSFIQDILAVLDRNIVKKVWQTDRRKEVFLELLGRS